MFWWMSLKLIKENKILIDLMSRRYLTEALSLMIFESVFYTTTKCEQISKTFQLKISLQHKNSFFG